MSEKAGVIYILTNPSFDEYVKIGYADDVDKRLKQLNRSECTPFAFRVYATYEVENRLSDLKLHEMIDRINPTLRAIDNVDGKKRIREFYAMTKEDAYGILEAIAEISGRTDRLTLVAPSEEQKIEEEIAEEIEEEHKERMSPFAFSKCKIPVGAHLVYTNRGNDNTGKECVVIDDKNVEYNGETWSLSSLATMLTGSKRGVAGPRYFKYEGRWLNDIRAEVEGRAIDRRVEDTWIIPCNPDKYDIVGAFNELDEIEWSQSQTNIAVGDTVYVYVAGDYHAIMYKCEVTGANLKGNRSDEDVKFYSSLKKSPNIEYMKLKMIDKYDSSKYPLSELKEHGLKSVQGRAKVTHEIDKFLQND